MKKSILTLILSLGYLIFYAQDITATIGENGAFKITSPGTTTDLNRFIITSDGHIGFNTLYDGTALTSSFHLIGSFATTVRTLTDTNAYIIRSNDHVCIIKLPDNNDDVDILLPSAVEFNGRELILKRDAGGNNRAVNILPSEGELVDGSPDGYTMTREYSVIKVVSNGERWWITSEGEGISANLYANDFTPSASDDIVGVNFSADDQVINLSLPPAAEREFVRYEIKRNANGFLFDNNSLRVIPASNDKLDHYTNENPYLMNNNWETLTIQSTGEMWLIIGNYEH